jgi:predicted small integral membrane protein
MPKWRKATWGLVIWSGLCVLWLVTGLNNVSQMQTGNEYEAAGAAIGTGIGVTLIFMVWFFGFVVGSLVWLMSRPKR